MEKRVAREMGQDLQADLGPGEGLEEMGRSKSLLERKFITRELNQFCGYLGQYDDSRKLPIQSRSYVIPAT